MRKQIVLCDRCGKEVSKEYVKPDEYANNTQLAIYKPDGLVSEIFDLCKKCYEEFINWWEEGQ